MAREHAAVEHPRDQVLGRVHALGVGQAHQAADPRAALVAPADVGPAGEVGLGVADVDDREHAEAHRGIPHRVEVGMTRRATALRLPVLGGEEEARGPPGACVLELRDGLRAGSLRSASATGCKAVGAGELFVQERRCSVRSRVGQSARGTNCTCCQ